MKSVLIKSIENFFANLPVSSWHTGSYINQKVSNGSCRCASGHLRTFVKRNNKWEFKSATPTIEVVVLDQFLAELYGKEGAILSINDGRHPCFPAYAFDSARERVLKAMSFDPNNIYDVKIKDLGESTWTLELSRTLEATEFFGLTTSLVEIETLAAKMNLLVKKNYKELYKVEK